MQMDAKTAEFGEKQSVFEFGASMPFYLPSGVVLEEASRELTWHFPNFTKKVMVRQLGALVHRDEATQMIHALPREFSLENDSVDLLPSFEHYLYHHKEIAVPSHPSAWLMKMSTGIIDSRLLPYVRERYNCPNCRVCTSLIRRYVAGERLRHPPHYDTQAFITVVVSLTAQHEHFLGGLYVRTDPGTEQFMPGTVGTAVLHQHDLEHGVWVQAGTRYSWILWLQDTPECSGPRPGWYEQDARLGDPVAQLHMSDLEKNSEVKASWLQLSAAQGYSRAQHKLGSAYLTGAGVKENHTTSLGLMQAAADQNSAWAAYTVGFYTELGVGTPLDEAEAALWYRRAIANAFEQYPAAMMRLAELLWRGAPALPQDVQGAMSLWQQAAEQGQALGAVKLATRYEMGGLITQNTTEAHRWYIRATELGHSESAAKVLSLRSGLHRGFEALYYAVGYGAMLIAMLYICLRLFLPTKRWRNLCKSKL
jgi:hypothetical protein